MTDTIAEAASPGDYEAFGALIREYVGSLRSRCADQPWLVDTTLGHQSLDRELDDLATRYARPDSKVLLARRDGEAIGGVAYRTLAPGICEMKRLFVPARFQGHGIGRRLCGALIGHARADGFSLMRLDSLVFLDEALRLYRSIGFVDCPPYVEYPDRLRPFIVFMELRLSPGVG